MPLTRRQFFALAGGAAATGTGAWAALVRDHSERVVDAASTTTSTAGDGPPENLLVVLQLSGGNDGLNTLVPVADPHYHDARPTLGIKDSAVVALSGETRYGLHPALARLAPLWHDGRMAAFDAIGYQDSSRSHFQASDSWWTASPTRLSGPGWLGRWLDASGIAAKNPLAAIALGAGSPALLADHSYSTALTNLAGFRLDPIGGTSAQTLVDALLATASPISPAPTEAAAQQATKSAVDSVRILDNAMPAATKDPTTGDDGAVDDGIGPITRALGVAANLLSADIGTRVVHVGTAGFDTHSGEAATHQMLLTDLASGVSAFFAALPAAKADRVLLVTTSEFGRRVAENGSGGTDHGAGGVQFLFGAPVRGGVVGTADLVHLDQGDVRPQIDVRSLYAVALDWLGGPADEVLGGSYDRYGLLRK